MSQARIAVLEDRGVVAVGGTDAPRFLQDLVTANIDRVAETGAGYGALLTPQGKILFDFIILADGDGYLLDVKRSVAGDLAKRLGFYRLRAKVTVSDLSAERQVLAAWGGSQPPAVAGRVAADPRLAALGWRAVVPRGEAAAGGFAPADATAYHAHRIALGVPEGGEDFSFGDAFPHDADMDQLNGLDFRKGCYVGQEVVSRMEHRGTARRRVIAVEGAALPAAGTAILADGRAIGALGSSAAGRGLALVRLDKARQARDAGTAITAEGAALTLAIPPWASFGWPEAAAEEA